MRLEMKVSRPQMSNSTASLLSTFPTTPLLLVARFSSPPDVCNLCLTNQEHFFCTAGNDVGTNTQEEEHRGGNAPDALFCNKLLRFSL
jgi:hypothetical protein